MKRIFSLLVLLITAGLWGNSRDLRAQTAGIEGEIVVVQPDGSRVPAVNALVELYRLDVRGKYQTKTDKRGHFAHIGLPYGRYAIIVSGEGLTPYYEYNVRIPPPGEATLRRTIEMVPGDGRRPTLEEIQQAVARSGPAGATAPQMTEAERKRLEEQARQIEEQRKRAAKDEEMIRQFNAANELARAGKYEEAIPLYKSALETSPDHPQLYVVMIRMAEAYHNLGVERFNNRDREAAKEAFNLAIETARKAISMIPPDKPEQKPEYQGLLCRSLAVVATYLDSSKLPEAIAAHEELMAMQVTPADRARTQAQIAKIYLDTARSEEAVAAYRKALEIDPNNLDALFGLGNALAQSPDPAKYPEALAILKDFVEKAKRDPQRANQVQQAQEMIAAFSQFLEEQKQGKGQPRRRP
jgi:tetratricopeptide (TPR) repeat protein